MPKLKTNSAAKKRFKITKNGKVKHSQPGKRHLLEGKAPGRKRNLRKAAITSLTLHKKIKRLMPYA